MCHSEKSIKRAATANQCCAIPEIDATIIGLKQVYINYRIRYNEQPTRDDTRDTCVVSQYFVLLRYIAVYRDLGDTSIVAYVSTISIEVSWASHNTTANASRGCLCIGVR